MDIEFTDIENNILFNKKKHIDICLNQDVSSKALNYFDDVNIKHDAMSELDFNEIDTSDKFLNYNLSMPFFISSMTGGVREGNLLNKTLVKIANKFKIPIGLGSFKLLFKYREYIKDFKLKSLAEQIPLFSNIGVIQARDFGALKIIELAKTLEVDAQILHLNSAQELMNSNGDRSFKGIRETIKKLVESSPIPIIVKEVGFGLSIKNIKDLLELGVYSVDIAGNGGTNWALVEGFKENDVEFAQNFSSWGNSALLVLLSHNYNSENILFSGGIKKAMDFVKAIFCGAKLVGSANLILKTFYSLGDKGVVKLLEDFKRALKISMFLSNSKNLKEARDNKIWLSSRLEREINVFKRYNS